MYSKFKINTHCICDFMANVGN